MQSYLQYRRLRREVEEDLAYARQMLVQHSDSEDKQATKLDPALVPGVTVSRPDESNGETVYVVGWKDNDTSNPMNWSLAKKWLVMISCCLLAIALTIPSSVEGPTQDAFNEYFHVNAMAGSMTTGKQTPFDTSVPSCDKN